MPHKRVFSLFEKNTIYVYTRLRYADKKLKFACKIFLENVSSNTKFDLRWKKIKLPSKKFL